MKRLTLLMIAVLTAAVLFTGCQAATMQDRTDADGQGSTAGSCAAPVELILSKYDGALPLSCIRETENGAQFWDVDILMPDSIVYEIQTNADGTAIQRTQREDDRPDIQPDDVKISYTTAVREALSTQETATFEGFELEKNASGRAAYEVEMRDAQSREIDVSVDAVNGEILTGPQSLTPVWNQVPFTEQENDSEDMFEELFDE